jgi:excisionase family DNA binding protein
MPQRTAISVAEAARRIDVAPITIRRWIAQGRLPGHRLGPRLIRVFAEDIEKMTKPIGGEA